MDDQGAIFNYLGTEYFIPAKFIKEKCHPFDQNDFGYTTCYFFRKRKKFEVPADKQKPDYIITNTKKYEKDVFYKLVQISKNAKYFDYYMKVKDDCDPNVLLESSCHNNCLTKKIKINKNIVKQNGKFVVSFQ
jgi:hypothetical protein